ncbi:hypothetical protein ACJ41O_004932 [Fusarium nematophilum]
MGEIVDDNRFGTYNEFIARILVDDDVEEERNALLLIGALQGWFVTAPRPIDHGDPVTQGRVPRGRQPELSRAHADWLFNSPPGIFSYHFRMEKAVFKRLCMWLRINTTAGDSRQMYLTQKVMVFVWLMAAGEVQRNAAWLFQLNQGTISRIFHQLIEPFRTLHNRFVIQPTTAIRDLSPAVELDRDFCQFNGAVGAIDGTHVRMYVPLDQQPRWWSRKAQVSTNVLAAVNFEGRFVYVLAGAEGSINDASMSRIAVVLEEESARLRLPEGRFYLADAGFGVRKGILTPFPRHLYYLRDFLQRRMMPQCEEELFNRRHCELRQAVERAFGMWKRKFRILRNSPPEYKIDDQLLIIYATAGLYNFIISEGVEPAEEKLQQAQELTEEERGILVAAQRRADSIVPFQTGPRMREHIAAWIWKSYGLDEVNDDEGIEVDLQIGDGEEIRHEELPESGYVGWSE